jgi:hypothetical protein
MLDEIQIKKQIELWVSEFVNPYCLGCKDHCCDTSRHLISIQKQEPAVELFKEKNIKVYSLDGLNQDSVKRFLHKGLGVEVLTRSGEKVARPSLVEVPIIDKTQARIFGADTEYALYTNHFCPFYEKEKGCEVYNDGRRPVACNVYPIKFETCNIGQSLIGINDSCPVMKDDNMKTQLINRFPDIPWVLSSELLAAQAIRENTRIRDNVHGKRFRGVIKNRGKR